MPCIFLFSRSVNGDGDGNCKGTAYGEVHGDRAGAMLQLRLLMLLLAMVTVMGHGEL